MREILFRGKRIAGRGEWVVGSFGCEECYRRYMERIEQEKE